MNICGSRMPKQKTHKGAKKRFRVSAKGKVLYRKAGTSHLLSHMNTNRKRKLRKTGVLGALDAKRIRQMIGS